MATGSSAAKMIAETVLSPAPPVEQAADALLASYEGDPHAAVVTLLKAVRALKDENRVLRGAASPESKARVSFGH
jgi:hypothetical protein